MISMYLDMDTDDLGKFLEEVSKHANKLDPLASFTFGELDLIGGLSIALTPGNRLHLVMNVHQTENRSDRKITVTINEKG